MKYYTLIALLSCFFVKQAVCMQASLTEQACWSTLSLVPSIANAGGFALAAKPLGLPVKECAAVGFLLGNGCILAQLPEIREHFLQHDATLVRFPGEPTHEEYAPVIESNVEACRATLYVTGAYAALYLMQKLVCWIKNH